MNNNLESVNPMLLLPRNSEGSFRMHATTTMLTRAEADVPRR
jgi:hypothetical protein